MYTLLMLYIKQVTNEDLLCSTGDLHGKEIQRRGTYVYIRLIHFAVQ